MENSKVEHWDLRGWMGIVEPTPNAQRMWNKSLIEKINLVSDKILESSMRYGADTMILHHDLEILLDSEHYDDFRKKLNNVIDAIYDIEVDRNIIQLQSRKGLEDLSLIPFKIDGNVVMKPFESCSEEEIKKYVEGLIGFIIIDSL
jgi:hypothetical protein